MENYHYDALSKILHWTLSILIITLLAVGYIMTDLDQSPTKWQLYNLHKATGVLVLSLVVIRIIWRLMHKIWIPDDLPVWQKKVVFVNFVLLYILMCIMPFSGIGMSLFAGYEINVYGLFSINSFTKNLLFAKICHDIHFASAYLLSGLVILHISAALYHHFIRKDGVLLSMIK